MLWLHSIMFGSYLVTIVDQCVWYSVANYDRKHLKNSRLENSRNFFIQKSGDRVLSTVCHWWSRNHQQSSLERWWESQCTVFPTRHRACGCREHRTTLSMRSRSTSSTSCESSSSSMIMITKLIREWKRVCSCSVQGQVIEFHHL